MRKVVNCLSCIVLIFVMVSLFGCGTDERYFRDEYGNKRLDNDEVLIESTVVNSTAYYFYKDNIGDGGSSHVLKKSLLRADGKRIRKDEKSYLIIGIYGRGYNFETFFNASLVDGSDIYFGNDVATFDEAICENINLIDSETKERCKYQSYSKLSLDMSKKNNERLKIDGGIVQFLVAIIPFTPLKEGLLNINLEITRLSSGYTDDHDYTYHKNHQIIIGDDDNTEKIKINDFKVRFISDLDCPDGVINEQKLKNNARFISGVENYMVIDIDYEATKNNDGNDIVDIYVCTSDAQFLHSTIHDVPSGDVEEKTIGDIRYMRVSLKVPKIKRENKNVRLIFKLFLEDDAITDLQILLDSNVLKTSNYVQDYYVIKSSEYGLKLSLSYKNYYVVTKCLDQEIEEVIIPSEYKGMPVKEIYDGAFKDCMLLKNIIIPDSVEVIGSHAFDNCMSLVSITLPKNLEEIESWAFANCKSLNDIVFSKNLKKIDYQAFEGCDELNLLEYDNALYLGDSDNPYLILIKAISTDIDNCIINENCKFIYDEAFYECKNLASIEFPDSVIGIGSRVIYGCKELNDNNIVLSNHLQYIYYSFTTDYSSSTGYFGTKDNEYYALVSVYRYCEEFTIHDGCVLISEDVFHFCDDLKTVTIPNSVKYIDSYAFYYSDSLNTIYYYGTEEEWNSFDLSLKNVNVIFK